MPETRSDLFSLAGVLYELLTGEMAEGGYTRRVLFDGLAAFPEKDRWLFELIAINLSEAACDRYYSARAVRTDLERRAATALHPLFPGIDRLGTPPLPKLRRTLSDGRSLLPKVRQRSLGMNLFAGLLLGSVVRTPLHRMEIPRKFRVLFCFAETILGKAPPSPSW